MEKAWQSPFSVSATFSRYAAGHIAKASCLGWITTRDNHGAFGRTWFITAEGLDWLLGEDNE